ncbi:hypothetical protein JTB14_005099 [Gonioctena quinquepunctata]|nr:hypothetical protein JTB14_005099 [Gonioctena quinquepunctata]
MGNFRFTLRLPLKHNRGVVLSTCRSIDVWKHELLICVVCCSVWLRLHLEIKCLHKVAELRISPEEATKKNICLEHVKDQLRLKRNHLYYYQVQGQLNICRRIICYFVVFVDTERGLFIEKIERDKKFWNEMMLPKLSYFYQVGKKEDSQWTHMI